MAADLGGSQISALLESVPGIRNVLRSPVADALVNMMRAAAGLRPFALSEAEELVQYAVRRGLINESEGERVLEEVKGAGTSAARAAKSAAGKRPRTASGTAKNKKAAGAKPGGTRRPVKKR